MFQVGSECGKANPGAICRAQSTPALIATRTTSSASGSAAGGENETPAPVKTAAPLPLANGRTAFRARTHAGHKNHGLRCYAQRSMIAPATLPERLHSSSGVHH